MKRIKLKLFLINLVFVVAQSCQSQVHHNDLTQLVNQEAKALLKDHRFTSVSIAVYNNGESYIGHYGELDKGANNTPTNATLYEIASVTKTMVGYLVATAVNEGKLDINTPVYNLLGEAYKNLAYKNAPVRIKHLITHTSGLPLNVQGVSELYQSPSPLNYQKAQQILSNYTKKEFLKEVRSLKINRNPGETYSYSNVAPNLLAYILEVVYNQPFEQLLEEKLFGPAQMTNTAINLNDKQQTLLAPGYNDQHQPMPQFKTPIQLWGAEGRVKSNSEDLLNYLQWQLNKDNPVVQLSHQKLFYDMENIWIGYFWEVIQNDPLQHIEHHGGIYGCQNWLIIHPEENTGISIISNSSFPEANRLLKQTANQILGKLK